VVAFDSPQIDSFSEAEELSGKLQSQFEEQKLMHLVLQHDKHTIEDGKLAAAALNHGISFTPDMLFEKLVKDYAMTEHIYGDSLIQLVSGYNPNYLKKNVKIPEFQRKLKQELKNRYERLKKEGYINRQGNLTEKAVELASLVLYLEELEHLLAKGVLGTKESRHTSVYGDKAAVREYRKGDRYRDIALKKSLKTAIRRLHDKLEKEDLRVHTRNSKGTVEIIYGLDASGSMKGKKIEMAKRAGIALAFTALEQKDRVGLLVFGSKVRQEVRPTNDFTHLIQTITSVSARQETNILQTIQKSAELFTDRTATRHLILLTDALPTIGSKEDTLEAVAQANAIGITISVVGISLDTAGKALAQQMVQLGKGRLYLARKVEELDTIILQDYYSVA
jgi:Mg-chelatase subunit ChlD